MRPCTEESVSNATTRGGEMPAYQVLMSMHWVRYASTFNLGAPGHAILLALLVEKPTRILFAAFPLSKGKLFMRPTAFVTVFWTHPAASIPLPVCHSDTKRIAAVHSKP